MEAFILSFGIIAISEIGDKTQLLALCLASQFRKPLPVTLGIFAATLASNAATAWLGQWIGVLFTGKLLHIMLGCSFLAAAVWALIPEKEEACVAPPGAHGIFWAVFMSFLLAEMGDKTQLTTVLLAARFHSPAPVILGTTLGMMAVNLPVVLFSHKLMQKISLKILKTLSGAVFGVLGFLELAGI